MRLKYNMKHLMSMADSATGEDKSALRWAMITVRNLLDEVKQQLPPKLPYWRYVRYADDGCNVYECLDCKAQWETRSEPGWFNALEECGPNEGAFTYLGDKYYREREEPLYVCYQKYCGYCGIEWKGAIRSNINNEYMFGPRRQRIYRATRDHYTIPKPRFWWVIQKKEQMAHKNWIVVNAKWQDDTKLNPDKYNAVTVYNKMLGERAEYKSSQWRVIKKKESGAYEWRP